MTRVIHTGDTHLGYRQYHSPERRADFLAAFRRVVEDAIEGDVDAVVHAGDLFHDRSPSLLDVHGAIQVLGELRDAEIRPGVALCHDCLTETGEFHEIPWQPGARPKGQRCTVHAIRAGRRMLNATKTETSNAGGQQC